MKISKTTIFVLFWVTTFNTYANNIRIVAEHLPPYQIVDGTQVTGLSVDIVNALLAITKDQTKIEVFPWARAYQLALTKPNIFIMTLSRSFKREEQFNWVGQVASVDMHVWRLKSRPEISPTNIQDLTKYVIGVQRGDHHHEALVNILGDQQKLSVTSFKAQEMEMLFRERVDLILGNPKTLPTRINRIGLDANLVESALKVNQVSAPLYLAFSKQTSQATVDTYIKAFKQLEENGTLSKLRAKWLNRPSTKSP